MKTRRDGVENHAGKVINHTGFDLLQRWQIYLIIAPLILVDGYALIVVSLKSRPTTRNKQLTTA
ncbi:MAG: hypothetical protein KIT62_02410 [Cyclobacteriaceae bacterium]|nr:hypothetical protein [Cyclobacteriaceae bacterium]